MNYHTPTLNLSQHFIDSPDRLEEFLNSGINTTTTDLCLSVNGLESQDVERIVAFVIASYPNLKSVDLSSNHITDSSLFCPLLVRTTVERLDLSDNYMTHLQKLIPLVVQSNTLVYLNLECNEIPGDSIKQIKDTVANIRNLAIILLDDEDWEK